mgnify:CR=1 FL=1
MRYFLSENMVLALSLQYMALDSVRTRGVSSNSKLACYGNCLRLNIDSALCRLGFSLYGFLHNFFAKGWFTFIFIQEMISWMERIYLRSGPWMNEEWSQLHISIWWSNLPSHYKISLFFRFVFYCKRIK